MKNSEQSFLFSYFIVFICKLYKGQAKRYFNASLNKFLHRSTQKEKKRKNENERAVKKPIRII